MVCVPAPKPSTQRVRVVVVGDPGSGKASLCRQFINCTFASSQGQEEPFCTGTRTLLDVHEEAVQVTVRHTTPLALWLQVLVLT